MKSITILILSLVLPILATAQWCYNSNFTKGKTAMQQKQYAQAITFFTTSKQCSDWKNNPEPDKMIAQCKQLKTKQEENEAHKQERIRQENEMQLEKERLRKEEDARLKAKQEEDVRKEPERKRTAAINGISSEMVSINGGTFLMGTIDGESYEKPVHEVTVSGFYMGRYEVTQAQWKDVMGDKPSTFVGENNPVENVSWDDVQQFIQKLNEKTGESYRLPTEAEWEYACRAGSTTAFNTGDCLSTSEANYDGNSPFTGCSKGEYREKTMPVGSFSPNAWGLYDMHGNVREWCSDWFDSEYYSHSQRTNPRGASRGSNRVFRGGGWYSYAFNCRSACRNNNSPVSRRNYMGFRLVSPK